MTIRRAWPVVAGVVVAAVLLLAVLPTRTYLDQQRRIEATRARVALLDRENAKLAARITALQSDAEVERLAREQYQLVKPGEKAYAVLPAPAPPTTVAPTEPIARRSQGWWQRAWRTVTGG